jgi:iron complex outermembrane receptor protein
LECGVSYALTLDWHISDNILAQVVLSHRDNEISGKSAQWYTTTEAPAFETLDTSKSYAPEWNTLESENNSVKFDLIWSINEVFTLRTAYLKKEVDQPINNYTENSRLAELNRWYPDANVGDIIRYHWRAEDFNNDNSAVSLFLDASFTMDNTKHNITLGYSDSKYSEIRGTAKEFEEVYTSIDELFTTVEPDWSTIDGGEGRFSEYINTNIFIADEITFNEQWSTQLGLNYSVLESSSGRPSTGWEKDYDDSAYTPTVSILYKPQVNLTTYFTYMEALEQGLIVSESYFNEGDVLPPLKSKQIELGAKYEFSDTGFLLTTALFRIEKANQYGVETAGSDLDTYTQDGLAVHQGVEFGFNGKATENLTLLGGITLLEAKTKNASSPDLEGIDVAEVPNTMAKFYAEYALPAVNGLVFSGGVYYTGSTLWKQGYDDKIDAYT